MSRKICYKIFREFPAQGTATYKNASTVEMRVQKMNIAWENNGYMSKLVLDTAVNIQVIH